MAKKSNNEKSEQEKPVAGRIKNVPVFSIPTSDPYIDAVIRCYFKQDKPKKINSQVGERPFILEADDPAAMAALKNYIQRANGACDRARAIEAEKAKSAFEEYAKK
jgi:hypothetical protein